MTCPTCGQHQPQSLQVGDRLLGFCGGYFGRDSYSDKTVEAIGRDWVMARDDRGEPWCAYGDPSLLVEFRP